MNVKLLLSMLVMFFGLSVISVPNVQAVDVLNPLCSSAEVQNKPIAERPLVCRDDKNTANKEDALFGPNGIMTKIVDIIGIVIGVAAVIVIILAGIKLITSTGDANKISQARQAIIFSAVGLLVAATAKLIVEVILKKVG